jgi:hypothetical protein
MPLTAVSHGRALVGPLLDDAEWAQLKGSSVTLHPCGHRGFPRVSPLGTRHFVHDRECGSHRPESAEHLRVKAGVARAAAAAGWDVATEVPGPGYIADVLAGAGSASVAFEVQRSRQVLHEYRRRQSTYARAGVRCVWLARTTPAGHRAGPDLPLFLVRDWEAEPRCCVAGRWLDLDILVKGLLHGRCTWRERVPVESTTLEVLSLLCPVCGARREVEVARWEAGRCPCGLPVMRQGRAVSGAGSRRCCGYWGPALILGDTSRRRAGRGEVPVGHWCLSAPEPHRRPGSGG